MKKSILIQVHVTTLLPLLQWITMCNLVGSNCVTIEIFEFKKCIICCVDIILFKWRFSFQQTKIFHITKNNSGTKSTNHLISMVLQYKDKQKSWSFHVSSKNIRGLNVTMEELLFCLLIVMLFYFPSFINSILGRDIFQIHSINGME